MPRTPHSRIYCTNPSGIMLVIRREIMNPSELRLFHELPVARFVVDLNEHILADHFLLSIYEKKRLMKINTVIVEYSTTYRHCAGLHSKLASQHNDS